MGVTGHITGTCTGMAVSLAELPPAQLLADLPENFFLFLQNVISCEDLDSISKVVETHTSESDRL